MLPKRQRFMKLCHLSTWPLLESFSTFKRYRKPDCANREQQNCSRVLLLNCKRNLTKNFSKTYTSLSLMIGDVTGKLDNAGKRKLVTLTTFSFRLKNAQSSLPNNAREQPSRKSCKIAMHSPYHVKGHLLGALFLCIVKGASGNHETTSELH
jgi:hypothetical protein